MIKISRELAVAMPVELVRSTFAAPPVAPVDAMAEANHRIANNLAMVAGLVRMHARRVEAEPGAMESDKVRLLLEEIGSRIETIGRLHGLLARAEDGKSIDVCAYLREICGAVVASLTVAAKARLSHHSGGPCLMASERALPLGFIVVELVTNAVKYSHPSGVTGNITISCASAEGCFVVDVSDDGVGLPEGFDPMQCGGLGLRLMRSLAEQIKATLSFTDTGTGLSVCVRVPTA